MKKNLEKLTSLQEVSRVNPGQLQGQKREQMMTAISGQKWLPLLKTYNLNGSLEKMCEALLMSHWDCKGHSLTWKVLAIKPYHILFQLQGSVLSTEENESGLLLIQEEMENQSLEENQESLNNPNKSHYSEMWLTPSATNIDTRSEKSLIKRKKYRESTGRKTTPPGNLAEQVQYGKPVKDMWPTPTTQEIEHPQAELTESGRRKSKDGNSSHSLNLADSVKMWPTPTTKGYGHASEGQTLMLRKMVEEGVLTEIEAEQMMNGTTLRPPRMEKWKFPTPTARDYKDTGKEVVNSTRSLLPQKVAKNNKDEWINNGGSLSCNWVELLMGYPKGWTDMNNTDDSLKNVRVVWDENWEKDTPRVANKQDKRMHRLKGLGNAIVPQIAEMIGKAIMETE